MRLISGLAYGRRWSLMSSVEFIRPRLIGPRFEDGEMPPLESSGGLATLDPLDVSARLEEFKDMTDGWFEGEGVAPSPDGLDWLASEFEQQYASNAPPPYLYPTIDGGVRAEWSFGANAIVLEIDLRERSADWLWFDRNSDANQERRLNLNDDAEWAWLANEVRSMAEAG